jgi:hypothetical protein
MGVAVGKGRNMKNAQILYNEKGWNGKAVSNPFEIIVPWKIC